MSPDATDPFVGHSDMAARMRAFDWTRSSMGAVASWPQSLRSALSICTGSALPIAIYWGPDLVLLYNDAWSPIAGTKHPWALGRPGAEVWPELWTDIGLRFENVLGTGDPTYLEDALLPMHRHGYTEECYFNHTVTGIRGEGGRVDGIFNAVIETTYRVVSERRTRLLQRLGEETGPARAAAAACMSAARVLSSDGEDAPFCLVYLDSGSGVAHLMAAAGLAEGSPLAPAVVSFTDASTWPIGEALAGVQVLHVRDLQARVGVAPRGRPWPEAVHEALLSPLRMGAGAGAAGVLVIGVSPRRAVDEEYRQFAARAASILSATLASVTAYEAERSRAEGHGTRVTASLRKGRAHLPAEAVRDDGGARRPTRPNPHVIEALRWIPDAEDTADREVGAASGPLTGDELTTAPGRVLVVDDNADMRDYLARLLGRHWTVETVADGERALDAIARARPDLVLTDVMMPGIGGFGLLRALRHDAATRAIPVVVLSARAGEEARIEGIESGADDYVVKPFSGRELVARINAQMALARSARERADLLAREQAARRDAELQKTHLYSLFMQAPVAIAVLRGRAYTIELANGLACAIWRRSHDEVIGRSLLEAIPELHEGHWMTLLDEVYASGRPHAGSEVPARFRTADGRDGVLTYLNFVYTPLRTADGEVDGILVIATDVTSQVIAREEMRRLREVAESASRAKDEFLAMLGHELRNPLAPIRTALDLMRLRGIDSALRERQIIERQVAHLVALVDDLLDVSRITRGKLELRRTIVELSTVVARGIEMSSPLLDQHHHELTVDVPGHGLPVHGDPERLAQVVANLLTNAAKYTEAGGRIRVEAHLRDDEIVLAVRDSGVGIEAAMLPTIFDLFVQARQSLARSQGGLGLGLSIVRSLVQLHGGDITATSAGRGRGAEFVVTLPQASGEASAAAARRPAGAALRASGLRVLVVDDNIDAAELLAEWLSAVGHETTVVHDGPSALAAAERLPPDVALLDIGLPVMDGYELARRFAEHPRLRDVRLFALTGYGQETDRSRSLASGFAAHLVKPIDVDHLVALLEDVTPVLLLADDRRR